MTRSPVVELFGAPQLVHRTPEKFAFEPPLRRAEANTRQAEKLTRKGGAYGTGGPAPQVVESVGAGL
jgi:hypothetical protein